MPLEKRSPTCLPRLSVGLRLFQLLSMRGVLGNSENLLLRPEGDFAAVG
jgi:ABC-type tungstate transport system substrate-binding protein